MPLRQVSSYAWDKTCGPSISEQETWVMMINSRRIVDQKVSWILLAAPPCLNLSALLRCSPGQVCTTNSDRLPIFRRVGSTTEFGDMAPHVFACRRSLPISLSGYQVATAIVPFCQCKDDICPVMRRFLSLFLFPSPLGGWLGRWKPIQLEPQRACLPGKG